MDFNPIIGRVNAKSPTVFPLPLTAPSSQGQGQGREGGPERRQGGPHLPCLTAVSMGSLAWYREAVASYQTVKVSRSTEYIPYSHIA
jgi:hypothetical protein